MKTNTIRNIINVLRSNQVMHLTPAKGKQIANVIEQMEAQKHKFYTELENLKWAHKGLGEAHQVAIDSWMEALDRYEKDCGILDKRIAKLERENAKLLMKKYSI